MSNCLYDIRVYQPSDTLLSDLIGENCVTRLINSDIRQVVVCLQGLPSNGESCDGESHGE